MFGRKTKFNLYVLTIQPLPKVRHLIATVSCWLLSEWPNWYGASGPGHLHADLTAFAASELALPIGFVAFDDGIPVGFGALKVESIPSHRHLAPWAAAGFVLPECRGRGIGALLLQALVAHAKTLGHEHVYCGTSTSVSLLRRAAPGGTWSRISCMRVSPWSSSAAATDASYWAP